MGNYYYLVAQLPAITFAKDGSVTAPLSYEYFVDLCARFLTESELLTVQNLSLVAPRDAVATGSSFLDEWYRFEKHLRLALAQVRSIKMQKDFADSEVQLVTQDIQQIARTACGFDSPLDAELYLHEERLKKIDELAPIDAFCADSVYAYGLKLLMAIRMSKFDENEGMKSYRIIYERILGESK